jgi:integrase
VTLEEAASAVAEVAVPGVGTADRDGPSPGLPSERLARLARDTAALLVAVPAADRDGVAALAPAEAARVTEAVQASLAGSSKAAYASDWRRFTAWATDRGYPSLPAPYAVVAAYVTAAAAQQRPDGTFAYAPATLTRWVSSINQLHTAAGLEAPGRSELVRRALSGIRRIRATPPSRRAPLLLADIRGLVDWLSMIAGGWPAGVAARRDACVLLMGFAGAFRRSELAALTLADVTLHRTDGLHVRLRTSKTDQEATGRVVALPYGRDPATCPPCAWVRWTELLHAADTAPPEQQRRPAMGVLRLQAATDTPIVGEGEDAEAGPGDEAESRLHVCRTTRLPDPPDPSRPLLRTVHRTGSVGDRPVTGHAIREIIRRRAEQAGYTPAQIQRLGGHSLRAGFVTEAFRQGADAHAIMRQTGHRSHAVLETYAREHAPLVGNAVTQIGL